MSTGENISPEAGRLTEQEATMVMLFQAVERRFSEAVERQHNAATVRYFVLEELDGVDYYTFSLVKSYQDVISRSEKADVIEVMVPALAIDTEEPFVEKLTDNPDASFMVRRYLPGKDAVYLTVRIDRIDQLDPSRDLEADTGNAFFGELDAEERPMSLVMQIDSYSLIPVTVPEKDVFESLQEDVDPGEVA